MWHDRQQKCSGKKFKISWKTQGKLREFSFSKVWSPWFGNSHFVWYCFNDFSFLTYLQDASFLGNYSNNILQAIATGMKSEEPKYVFCWIKPRCLHCLYCIIYTSVLVMLYCVCSLQSNCVCAIIFAHSDVESLLEVDILIPYLDNPNLKPWQSQMCKRMSTIFFWTCLAEFGY